MDRLNRREQVMTDNERRAQALEAEAARLRAGADEAAAQASPAQGIRHALIYGRAQRQAQHADVAALFGAKTDEPAGEEDR